MTGLSRPQERQVNGVWLKQSVGFVTRHFVSAIYFINLSVNLYITLFVIYYLTSPLFIYFTPSSRSFQPSLAIS
ncbi:hypothetical protein SAMN05421579_11657 [Xenorhabdus japonica]|uniref:Uncharacterized protein n=1 Tax=Xenorhabdus japonica TaxID=53341 RepID=A0A1I5B8T6_9GAMM|nr:hypothetical protein SAMN05421579_11657 [Xenorhabdus japonica]